MRLLFWPLGRFFLSVLDDVSGGKAVPFNISFDCLLSSWFLGSIMFLCLDFFFFFFFFL